MISLDDNLNFRDMYVKEEYISYGRNDLERMTTTELKDELKRVEHEIEKIKDELYDSKSEIPTYSLKEQEKTTKLYRDKIMKEIESRSDKIEKDNESKNKSREKKHHFYPIKKFKKKITDYKQKTEGES